MSQQINAVTKLDPEGIGIDKNYMYLYCVILHDRYAKSLFKK